MIHDNLLSIAARAPATSGLRYKDSFQSYPDLVERITRLASGVQQRGIEPGQTIAILVPNSPELFVIVHALFCIGAVAMPLSTAATRDEVAMAMRKANGRAMIVRPELGGLATDVRDVLGADFPILFSGGEGEDSVAFLERATPRKLPQLQGDTPALYMLSSGSTGLPKVVPHTHAELLADAHRTSTAWKLQPDDIVFDMLPGNFAMGLLLGAMDAAQVGATTVYWNDPRPLVLARRGLVETIIRERVTVMGAVPAMYEVLVGTPGEDRFAAMRLAFSGGAGLKHPAFLSFRERFGLPLRQSYGSTESIMFSHNDCEDIDAYWASVGAPAGDGEARIEPMETGLGDDVGELLVKSSSVMTGYLGDDRANAATFADGWLRTGDLARLDEDGRIFIVGRSKLLIEVSGYKIDPLEVEDVLAAHPDVVEAAVVGSRPAPNAEQRLKAFIVRSGSVGEDALIAWLRERLSAQKVPSLYAFVDELPKSSAGKILRSRLTESA